MFQTTNQMKNGDFIDINNRIWTDGWKLMDVCIFLDINGSIMAIVMSM